MKSDSSSRVSPLVYRSVSLKRQPYLYLRIKLVIEGEDAGKLSPVQYKFLIMQAIKENLGDVGASCTLDVLKLLGGGQALLRLPSSKADQLWAAITLYGTTPSLKSCAFTVLQVSPFLMGLAFDSREDG